MNNKNDVIGHYDRLIDDGNDPFYDTGILMEYMDKWDGEAFIGLLGCLSGRSVLEIGVGTGRVAARVCDKCGDFTGVDISFKTVEKARENLIEKDNVKIVCGDFLEYDFNKKFDIIYSTLTFMHINEKLGAIKKIYRLLNRNGIFVLSLDKSKEQALDYNGTKLEIYLDSPEIIKGFMSDTGFDELIDSETEFASIIKAVKT